MSKNTLANRKVAILMTDGFEEIEFTEPSKALREAGANVRVITPGKRDVKAWAKTDWGDTYSADLSLEDADSSDFDALMLPGGVMNPDSMRTNNKAVTFISEFLENQKPVAAICHAPQLLTETGLIKGMTMTSYPSVKTDLKNAGVNWVDQDVVVDKGVVTSRKPDDLPAFNKKMIEEFCEGKHEQR